MMKADVSPNVSPDGSRAVPIVECISYSPQGAAIATGRSRSRIFKAIKDKELVARKDGRATLLEADELRRWVRSLPTITEATARLMHPAELARACADGLLPNDGRAQ